MPHYFFVFIFGFMIFEKINLTLRMLQICNKTIKLIFNILF